MRVRPRLPRFVEPTRITTSPSSPTTSAGDRARSDAPPSPTPTDPASARQWRRQAVTAGTPAAALLVIAAAVITALVVLGVPAPAAADPAVVPVGVRTVVLAAPPTSVNQVLNNLRAFLVSILAGLATLALTVGAVRYLWAQGDPGEIGRAKEAFRGAAIGYLLAALAPLGVAVLQSIVGG